jgi:uncharacterized membrane protein YoaK (UPF0700 family)
MKNGVRALSDVSTGLYIITATCGIVDAVCFLALGGVFAEMMTGNLLLMSLSIGTGGALGDTARYLPAMLAFMCGALLGGRLLRGPHKLRERRIGFAVEGLVIVAATVVTWRTAPDAVNLAGHVVVVMLAFAMGIQNAMVRTHGIADLATNVMTVTFTAVIADSRLAGGDNHNWRRRGLSIGLFCAGAAVGAFLAQFGVVWPLALTSLLFAVAMIPLTFGRHPTQKAPTAP